MIRLSDDPDTPDINESEYIRLAEDEQRAIDGVYIDLKPGATLNSHTFELDRRQRRRRHDHDRAGHRAVRARPVGDLPRERHRRHLLRRRRHDASSTPTATRTRAAARPTYTPSIAGLIHNTKYWVLSSPNQFGLQGDNRLVDKQVIKLGKLENEVRGGVTIDLSTSSMGKTFTLTRRAGPGLQLRHLRRAHEDRRGRQRQRRRRPRRGRQRRRAVVPVGLRAGATRSSAGIFGKLADKPTSGQPAAARPRPPPRAARALGNELLVFGAFAVSITDHDAADLHRARTPT